MLKVEKMETAESLLLGYRRSAGWTIFAVGHFFPMAFQAPGGVGHIGHGPSSGRCVCGRKTEDPVGVARCTVDSWGGGGEDIEEERAVVPMRKISRRGFLDLVTIGAMGMAVGFGNGEEANAAEEKKDSNVAETPKPDRKSVV